MKSLDRQIRFAIETLVRQSETGELHGDWDFVVDKLTCELGGPCYPETIEKFKQHLMEAGLEFLTLGSQAVFFRSMDGSLHLVHRDTLEI